MEKVLFWRTVTKAEDFEREFDDANVEFVEFESEDAFDATEDIFEITSDCICYNPKCPDRRYQDTEGRIYARCIASDVGGDIVEQIRQSTNKDKEDALADIEKYISETGFVTRNAEAIIFADAPAWWRKRCVRWIADCFGDDSKLD